MNDVFGLLCLYRRLHRDAEGARLVFVFLLNSSSGFDRILLESFLRSKSNEIENPLSWYRGLPSVMDTVDHSLFFGVWKYLC